MKKMITTAVAVVLAFVFTACGGNSTNNNVNDEFAGNDESVNGEPETSDETVSDSGINWDVVGHEGEPCFPNNTCHEGLKCRNGKCVDDGGFDNTGKLNYPCYPDGTCRSDDMMCENGICVERNTVTDDNIATDEGDGDNVVPDEDMAQVDQNTPDDTVTDNTVTDDAITPEADNSTPDVDNVDPLTGIEAGHPCYPNGTCESIKGLICVEGTCQYPGTDTGTVDNDTTGTDADNAVPDGTSPVENETDVDNVDTDIAPDTDNVPSNIGNKGQSCYPNKTCNGVLVCIKDSEVCADKPIAVPGQYEGRCWDWRDPITGKTTCETEGWYWSPAIWPETSEQFPLCIGSSTRYPYLAECQLQTVDGQPRSTVWYKYPPQGN